MFIDANKIEYKGEILELLYNMPDKLEKSLEKINEWLDSRLGKPTLCVWLNQQGIIIAELIDDFVYISFWWALVNGELLFEKVVQFAKDNNATKIIGSTNTLAKARVFQNKYKAKIDKITMVKEL